MTKTTKPSMTALAKLRRQGGRICGVCASPHRRFIERAFLVEGHSKRAIRDYFKAELGIELPTLSHHFANHVGKED